MIRAALCLWFLVPLLNADNLYDDPLTKQYRELYKDVRSYVVKILLASRHRNNKLRFKPETTQCRNRCNETRSKTFYCHCDANCELYRDCCYDYWGRCKKNKTVEESEQDKWTCRSDLYKSPQRYIPWYDFSANVPRIRGHMMISSCPGSFSEFEYNCTNPDPDDALGKIPVEGIGNLTYRNKYCALCNENDKNVTKNWRYEIMCPTSKNAMEKIKDTLIVENCMVKENSNCTRNETEYLKTCYFFYAPPKGISKKDTICSPVKTCPQTPVINVNISEYQKRSLKCQAYMRIVYHNGTYYRNFHCALCHGIDALQLQQMPIAVIFPTLSVFFEIPRGGSRKKRDNEINCTNGTGDKNSTDSAKNKSSAFPGEEYITFVGFIISAVSLVALLGLYSLVKSLRTTPGKIIIGLSISILSYHIMLFVSKSLAGRGAVCTVTAMLLHFAILLSFGWMSVMGYDVWKTFGKNSETTVLYSSTFLYYALYAVISPLILVLTAIVVDQTAVLLVYSSTHENDQCWIEGSLSYFLFFTIPVGLSLAVNVIALVWTAITLSRVQKKTEEMFKNKKKHGETLKKFEIYGKLCVVMGLTWILGFTIEISTVFRFLYVAINSLQGFFIFLAFVVNKRVIEKCQRTGNSRVSRVTWWIGQKTSCSDSSRKSSATDLARRVSAFDDIRINLPGESSRKSSVLDNKA